VLTKLTWGITTLVISWGVYWELRCEYETFFFFFSKLYIYIFKKDVGWSGVYGVWAGCLGSMVGFLIGRYIHILLASGHCDY
jgi:hypothetical protein